MRTERERERERKISRLRLRLCTDHAFDFAPIAPQDHTETAPIALRSHHTVASKRHWSHRLHWERTQGSHWDRTDLSLSRSSVAVLRWPDLMNFFFLLGFVSVFIYWEIVLYICLEVEKIWEKCEEQEENMFSILFSTTQSNTKKYFPKHFLKCNQILENIFLSRK